MYEIHLGGGIASAAPSRLRWGSVAPERLVNTGLGSMQAERPGFDSYRQVVLTSCGAHPACCPVDARDLYPGSKLPQCEAHRLPN
jgi:hypothetical protein